MYNMEKKKLNLKVIKINRRAKDQNCFRPRPSLLLQLLIVAITIEMVGARQYQSKSFTSTKSSSNAWLNFNFESYVYEMRRVKKIGS